MAKEIYINVSIVKYTDSNYTRCELVQSVDDGPLESIKLDELKAHKLIWELVKAGGRRSYHTNYLNNSIITQDAYIFLPSVPDNTY